MSESIPIKIIKAATKPKSGAAIMAGLLMAMQRNLDPVALTKILEDATDQMRVFKALRRKEKNNA